MDKVFDRAWKLIAAPERWSQNSYARDAQGSGCLADSERAVRWCAGGAIKKVYGNGLWFFMQGRDKLVAFNDAPGRKHSEVMKWLKERDL